MEYMNYIDFLKNLRTQRVMEPTAITTDFLDSIINHARLASSARNMQPIRFAYISEANLVDEVFNQTNLASMHNIAKHNAPSAFIVLGIVEEYNDKFLLGLDMGISSEIIREALLDNGYASVAINSFNRNAIDDIVGVANFSSYHLIAIGKSNQQVNIYDGVKDTMTFKDENNIHTVCKLTVDQLVVAKK